MNMDFMHHVNASRYPHPTVFDVIASSILLALGLLVWYIGGHIWFAKYSSGFSARMAILQAENATLLENLKNNPENPIVALPAKKPDSFAEFSKILAGFCTQPIPDLWFDDMYFDPAQRYFSLSGKTLSSQNTLDLFEALKKIPTLSDVTFPIFSVRPVVDDKRHLTYYNFILKTKENAKFNDQSKADITK